MTADTNKPDGNDTAGQPGAAAPQVVPAGEAGIREYQVLCLFALGVVFLLDLQQGNSLLSMLLLLVGVMGVLSRLRHGPIVFLLMLAILQWMKQHAWTRLGGVPLSAPHAGFMGTDLIFSMAVLAYVLAQYRLQSLVLNILPVDSRRRSGARRWLILPPRLVLQGRPGTLVTATEIGLLLLLLPIWALAAQGLWTVLFPPRVFLGLPSWLCRLVIFTWGLGIVVFVAASALDLWQRHRSRREIATLYLQDVLWRETRGEQRRLNRWTAWWRIRRKE